MDKSKFINYVKNPGEVTINPDLNMLNRVLEHHPYFQSAYLLLTVAYHQNNSIFFDKTLQLSAVYANDREQLYRLINHPYQYKLDEPKPNKDKLTRNVEEQAVEQEQEKELEELNKLINHSAPAISHEQLLKDIEKQGGENEKAEKGFTKTEKAEFSENRNLAENENTGGNEEEAGTFFDWLSKLKSYERLHEEKKDSMPTKQYGISPSGPNAKNETAPKKQKQKQAEQAILDNFLNQKRESHMPQSRSNFFDPSEMAKKSVSEDDSLVSEPLAQIYLQQGHPKKAIEIYNKLSLLYPDKFNYFAEKIKEIKAKSHKRK